MKLAVLSDIHSNHFALKSCLDYIDTLNIDGIIFLGDYVSDCPYPQKAMELVYEASEKYRSWHVKGNREEYLVAHQQGVDDGWIYSSNTGSLLYTYENLTKDDIEFFRSLPVCVTIQIDGYPPITVCHGSPINSREALYPAADNTIHYLKALESSYLLCGHTHDQYSYEVQGKTLINGGSVGAPLNGQTKSQFAVLESNGDKWDYEFISVEYAIQEAIDEFGESGFNEKALIWAKCMEKHLQTGTDYNLLCLELAGKLASEQEFYYDDLSQIPEKYWIQAAKELGIIEIV